MAAKLNLNTVPSIFRTFAIFATLLISHWSLPLKSKPNLGPHVGYSVRLGIVSFQINSLKNQTQSRTARGLQRTFWDSFPARTIHKKPKIISGRKRVTECTFWDSSRQNNSLKARGLKRTFFAHFLSRIIHLKPNLNLRRHVDCSVLSSYISRQNNTLEVQIKRDIL